MRRLAIPVRTALALMAVVFGGAVGLAAAEAGGRDRVALMPLKRGVRDFTAISALQVALDFQLTQIATVVGESATREVLRRHRLRDPDTATSDLLMEVATELQVDWLLSVTIHDVPRHIVPDVSVSMRLFDGATGELVWSDFLGRSGLDGEKLLGLGVIDSIELLIPEVVERLLDEVPVGGQDPAARSSGKNEVDFGQLGRIAIVPFTSYVERDAQEVADTATEATRAVLIRRGATLVSTGCIHEALRTQKATAWGQLSASARDHIHSECKADLLLTGSVEQWGLAGSGLEPEPTLSIALRVLDAESGRVLWMNGTETAGWDGQTLFGSGRVYSRGRLLDRTVYKLTSKLIQDDILENRKR